MIKRNQKPHNPIAHKAVADVEEEFAPLCPLYKKCGGCQLQNLPYKDQLAYKQSLVKRLLGRFGRVSPILGMQNPTHYRNKVQAAFGQDRHGQPVSGVFQSSSHRIVKVDNCLIEDRLADKIIVAIRHMLKDFKMPPL